ncbi:hypothetical protein POM88_036538 [Heracleum sosnowskyi]|uniref:Uncharacterized protein n=1 Tax=Heracleum sosnowskyi TaxID=360622 RepID=A0AAD8HNL2_9APIA|nr:hypothetical protein POM88_036538 [Heracleum sosnowskyi]
MNRFNSNIGSLPTELIVSIMQSVVLGGFKDFFNFFVAWSQTQKVAVVVKLLDEFPVRELYKFRNSGGDADTNSFDRFFRIGEQLRISDAVLYQRCRDIFRGVGNIDAHLEVLDGLASSGHFLSMVAVFILRNLYREPNRVYTLVDIVRIFNHPGYERLIKPTLAYLKHLYSSIHGLDILNKPKVEPSCILHHSVIVTDVALLKGSRAREKCLFCDLAVILNVFCNSESHM